jgi:hypothetical protein
MPSEDLTRALQKVQADSRFWIFPSTDLKNHSQFNLTVELAHRSEQPFRIFQRRTP